MAKPKQAVYACSLKGSVLVTNGFSFSLVNRVNFQP